MKTATNKVTRRQSINLANAIEELKKLGNFDFRVAVASIFLEAKTQLEMFNEARTPTKGMDIYQEECRVILENCTSDVNGKKQVDTARYIPLMKKAAATHADALEAYAEMQKTANKSLDETMEIFASKIPFSLVKLVDEKEPISPQLLSCLLPFMEKE